MPTEGEVKGVDLHCIAYKTIFKEISDMANNEMFASSGLEMGRDMGIPGLQPESNNDGKPCIMALMIKRTS